MKYLNRVARKNATPQSEPMAATQVPNSAGGYAWPVDDWTRLNRFLILGSEGGSYYAAERALTQENAKATLRCIDADGERAVKAIVNISVSGRAPKNDPALFALALAAACDNDKTRKMALDALPQVARIGTHLMHFAAFIDGQRGWGRGLRNAFGAWFNDKAAADVAYQALKYQARDGWSQRDLLRLAHPQPPTDSHRTIYHWITQGWNGVGAAPHPDANLQQIWAFERAKAASTCREVAGLIRDYRLPREAVPTQFLNEVVVWEALLEAMPMTALVRNLATLTRIGLLSAGSDAMRRVVAQITDEARLKKARVHPIALLSALKTYAQGHGERSKNSWTPVPQIVDALDKAFYLSFGNIVPTNQRYVLGLDVSGSMGWGDIAGVPGLTPRVASAAMALITAATERDYRAMAFATTFMPLAISPRQRLDDVLKVTGNLSFGGTDCAQPMLWAMKEKVEADVFVIYTDSETWHGKVHPVQALQQYRQKTGIAAKLIVVGMVANGFSIADPNDGGMLDVVGFDTSTPQLMSDFVRGSV